MFDKDDLFDLFGQFLLLLLIFFGTIIFKKYVVDKINKKTLIENECIEVNEKIYCEMENNNE